MKLLTIVFSILLFCGAALAETYVKIALKDFNAPKLMEELNATGLPITSIGWSGFDRPDPRRYTPKASRTQVGYSSSAGADFADPGEMRIATSRALTPLEDTNLTGLLTAHFATVLTAEQQRQDQDNADLNQLMVDYGNWDLLNNTQRFLVLKRALRILIRRERGSPL